MKKVARMLRSHEGPLPDWFEAKGTASAGSVEGPNSNAKLAMRKAYGFRAPRGVTIALYHRLGALPEPDFTHESCRGGLFFAPGIGWARVVYLAKAWRNS